MAFNTDYLRWDAESIKRKIIQRLSQDPNFTDQIFEGSNLAVLIDAISVMFEHNTYFLNHGASEAMYEHTQFYENINSLVKFLGYNPNGYESCVVDINIQPDQKDKTELPPSIIIPKYSQVTGLSTTSGDSTVYSFVNNINTSITKTDLGTYVMSKTDKHKLVNGTWTLYPAQLRAIGLPFETFILDALPLDGDNKQYVAHPYVDVYIASFDKDTSTYNVKQWTTVYDGTLYGSGAEVYGPESTVVELRINEAKNYVLTFGNGAKGKRLSADDIIIVVYLKSDGPRMQISGGTMSAVNKAKIELTQFNSTTGLSKYFGIPVNNVQQFTSTDLIKGLLDIDVDESMLNYVYPLNAAASTLFGEMEDVESIRQNAPTALRSGGRLVTALDYKTFMLKRYSSFIYDVHIQDNTSYMLEFYSWLKSLRDCESSTGNRLKPDIRERNYPFADACDFNNVYIWTRFKGEPIDPSIILDAMSDIKCLTVEPIILNGINVSFVPCLSGAITTSTKECINVDDPEYGYDYRAGDGWDSFVENKIRIIKSPASLISAERIKDRAIAVITDYFAASKQKLGGIIDPRVIYSELLAIPGVEDIKTVYIPNRLNPRWASSTSFEREIATKEYSGIALAYWTEDIATGVDKEVILSQHKLKPFQYASLASIAHSRLSERIEVVLK